jgi:hypothetical protein
LPPLQYVFPEITGIPAVCAFTLIKNPSTNPDTFEATPSSAKARFIPREALGDELKGGSIFTTSTLSDGYEIRALNVLAASKSELTSKSTLKSSPTLTICSL